MWDFLDVMDKNLLYRYAEALNGNIKFFRVIDYEIDRKEQAEQRIVSDLVYISLYSAM